jgi:hypothetical protein
MNAGNAQEAVAANGAPAGKETAKPDAGNEAPTSTAAVIADIIDRLKHLIADHGFFCFLADRNYYEMIDQRIAEGSYPTEHTYFSRRILILHRPADLTAYAEQLVEGHPKEDALAHRLFGLVVAYRSRMNFADVGRAVDAFITTDEHLLETLRPGIDQLLTGREMRLAATVQLAINEVILTPPFDLHFRSDPDPAFMQMAIDALYVIPRAWAQDARKPIILNETRIREEMLKRKCGCMHGGTVENTKTKSAGGAKRADPPAAPDTGAITIPEDDLSVIWKMVELQIELLSDFGKLRDAIVARIEAMNQPLQGAEIDNDARERATTFRDIVLTGTEIGQLKGLIAVDPAGTLTFLLDENCLDLTGGVGLEVEFDEVLKAKQHKSAIERLIGLLARVNVDVATLARHQLLRSTVQLMNLGDMATALGEADLGRPRDERLRRAEDDAGTLTEALDVAGSWLATALTILERLRRDMSELGKTLSNDELLKALVRHVPMPSEGAGGAVPPAFLAMTGQVAPPPSLALNAVAIDAFSKALAAYAPPALPRAPAAP